MKKTVLWLSAAIAIVFLSLFIQRGAAFEGTDALALGVVADIDPNYTPWVQPFFVPPSSEIESLAFSLQATIGGGLLGCAAGYWAARRRENAKSDEVV